MRNILVPIDFSEAGAKAVAEASVLAGAFDARLVLLHVVEPMAGEPSEFGYLVGRAAIDEARRSEYACRLVGLRRAVTSTGVRASTLLAQGGVGHAIIRCASHVGSAYIVMGSRAHGVLHDLFLGSITRHVLQHATCPVMVVSPDHCRRRDVSAAKSGAQQRRVRAA